jgi:sortase system peptidoglycan-associated protein
MKKSLLNTAISMALSAALFSASVLTTKVYANEVTSVDNNSSNDNTTEDYMLPGMAAGAAAGAVVAGPAGLLIGGIIGAFVGSNQVASDQKTATDKQETVIADVTSTQENSFIEETANTVEENIDWQRDTAFSDSSSDQIHVAQLGAITPKEKHAMPVQDELINILTTDLSLDVYFRSGSTAIESFYPERLAAIAQLMKTMETLELHLDGYTDRRGNKSENIILADQRIDKVRQQLVFAGVEDHRIISKAFGEMKMVSSPGDLDGYTFDRKVVIRFERTSPDSIQSMAAALADTTDRTTDVLHDKTGSDTGSHIGNETSINPVVADAATRF